MVLYLYGWDRNAWNLTREPIAKGPMLESYSTCMDRGL
jgi:hypothetical protein